MPTFKFESPEGKTYSVDGPDGATKEQAFQILQQHLGSASSSDAPQESVLSDVGKSVASGLGQGSATVVGLPGNIASMAHAIAPQGVIDAVKSIPGAQAVYNHLPTSQGIIDDAVKNDRSLVDLNYEPQHAATRYLKSIAAGAGPGLVTGMGVPATLLSSVLGQVAYDATDSHLAEAGASLVGGVGTQLAMAARARKALMPLLSADQVKAAGDAGYANPLLKDTQVKPQAVQGVAGDMDRALANGTSPFFPAQSPRVAQGIERLADRSPGIGPPAPVSIAELHSARKTLGKIGQETADFKPTEQAAAAGTAKRVLDKYLDNIPSGDVVKGNPIDAVQALRDANANWRYGNSAEKLGNIIQKATDKAGTQHSGLNYGNIQRQGLQPLLDNNAAKLKMMGMGSPDEIDAVRTAVQGDVPTNLIRQSSNMLGGGGGIASSIIGHTLATAGIGGTGGAIEGAHEGGIPGAIIGAVAGAAPGISLRLLANARTRKAAKAIQDSILSKAPANAGIVTANNAARQANKLAKDRAVAKSIPFGTMLLSRLMSGGEQ